LVATTASSSSVSLRVCEIRDVLQIAAAVRDLVGLVGEGCARNEAQQQKKATRRVYAPVERLRNRPIG
jgi:hypothetical protein